MATNPHTITHTRASSTSDLGYRSLQSMTGPAPLPSHVVMPQPAPGPASNFRQGVVDAYSGQTHHVLRAYLVGAVVGAVVGHEVARMRNRW